MIDIKKNSFSEGFVLLGQKGLPKIGVTTPRRSPVKIGILQNKQQAFGYSLTAAKQLLNFSAEKGTKFIAFKLGHSE